MYNRHRLFRSRPNNHRRRNAHAHRPSFDVSRLVKRATADEAPPQRIEHTFPDFALDSRVAQNIAAHGYTQPTPVQDRVIPEVLAGRDVVGIAQTGTGKTAAFLLPLITKLCRDHSQRVLVVAPTRELALQIDEEFRKFARGTQVRSAACVGGMSMYRQIQALTSRPQFVIGTPGRLLDLEHQGRLRFGEYRNVVLDEVDRMLDMGFIRDIRTIMGKVAATRQTLVFSATLPDAIKPVMQQFLTEPVTVTVAAQHASDRVNQDVIHINGREKVEVLHDLLNRDGFSKVLLFGRTKWGIERLSHKLAERGFRVAVIHGNKRQSQRQKALEAFKHNEVQVLLATDVASRGIDVEDITHVINYDLPETYDDYIHRIGRTGRADSFGSAITFVD